MQIRTKTDLLVHPIQIPTPFAVGDVFSYLITDDKIVLVDCGHFAENSFAIVSDHLKNHGLHISDIDEIWLTHGHPDHFGQAARLADRSGAVLYGHPKERANFAGNDDRELFREFFDEHNIPGKFTQQMIDQLDWLQQYQRPIQPEWIEQGDMLSSGEIDVEVHFTPGHAPGHLCYQSNRELIFGGDLLLGHISTNALINFDPDTGSRNKSLLQYRESLKWMREQEGRVLPGHGEQIENISEVVDHHFTEHENRYQEILQLLQQESMGLMELSYHMFPDAISKGAIFLVLSEVLGYLDWGIEEADITLDESNMKYSRI